jgi:hypothetical protein
MEADVQPQEGRQCDEKDLVVAPVEYWAKTLRLAVEEMLQMKLKKGQRVRYI